MGKNEIKFGTLPMSFHNFNVSSGCNDITFSVTEECNLRCKYCYLAHKNSDKKMSFKTAKKAVDYILNERKIYNENSVVWNFIGGEPLLEIDLIDKISDYIKEQMYLKNHPWFDNYMFSIGTNGLLYSSEKVQKYIKKNKSHLSITISVDGNKAKHDMQRVYPNGKGSYDDVMKNVPLWLSQFPGAMTKATFSHGDLPYLKDSIIHLWNIGIKKVPANVVFEDVWEEGDSDIFEQQLKELADYVIEKNIFLDPEYTVQFFNPNLGLPINEIDKKHKYCGSGKMLAVSCDGEFFPCIRFTNFSMSKKKFGWNTGNINDGVHQDKLKPFEFATIEKLNTGNCKNCEVASGCRVCVGLCYDESENGSIFERTTYNCEMHKANVRAVDYFWDKVSCKIKDIDNPRKLAKKSLKAQFNKYLLIYTTDSAMPHCLYDNKKENSVCMSSEMIYKSLEFASKNNMIPVIIGDPLIDHVDYAIKIHSENTKELAENGMINLTYYNIENKNVPLANIYIFHVNQKRLNKLADDVIKLHKLVSSSHRINLILDDLNTYSRKDLDEYKKQLIILADYIFSNALNKKLCLDVFENLDNHRTNCGSGIDTFTVAPNGKLYFCPGIYFYDENLSIGSLENGFNSSINEIKNDYRCIYLNKKLTGEYEVEPNVIADLENIEKEVRTKFKKMLADKRHDEELEVLKI